MSFKPLAHSTVPSSVFRVVRDLALVVAGLYVCVAMAFLPGCTPPNKESSPGAAPAISGTKLRLLVVADDRLAEKAISLRGEWNARTGAEFDVTTCAESELEAGEPLPADAVIYPAYLLGQWAEHEQIVPLPPDFESDRVLGWSDTFDLLRTRCLVWDNKVYAVPLGSPSLVCYYREDLFRRFDRSPPTTWAEYQQLAEFFSDRKNLGADAPEEGQPWSGALEPLGSGWAGLTLLARAAAYAKHPSNYSTLFNIDSFEPLIDGPPFVRALDELVAAARLTPSDQRAVDPDGVRRRFWRSEAAMALSWPTAATKLDKLESKTAASGESHDANVRGELEVGFVPLPGGTDVYNFNEEKWEERPAPAQVPLLGIAGRVASITAHSEHPQAAFALLAFLAGTEWGAEVASTSGATTLFKRPQKAEAGRWAEKPVGRTAAENYARIVEANLTSGDLLFALRIPGRAEYLAALDEAVERALNGEVTSTEALQQAAARWRDITEEHGPDKQRRAYRASLGLSR